MSFTYLALDYLHEVFTKSRTLTINILKKSILEILDLEASAATLKHAKLLGVRANWRVITEFLRKPATLLKHAEFVERAYKLVESTPSFCIEELAASLLDAQEPIQDYLDP